MASSLVFLRTFFDFVCSISFLAESVEKLSSLNTTGIAILSCNFLVNRYTFSACRPSPPSAASGRPTTTWPISLRLIISAMASISAASYSRSIIVKGLATVRRIAHRHPDSLITHIKTQRTHPAISCTDNQYFLYYPLNGIDGFFQFCYIPAPALCHIRLAATPAPGQGRNMLYQLAGLITLLDQVGCYRHDK